MTDARLRKSQLSIRSIARELILAFNSLIFSCRFKFESFNFWASSRNWVTKRTASTRIADLSVLGGLPGSRSAPNSMNLISRSILAIKDEINGEVFMKWVVRSLVIQPISSQFLSASFGTCWSTWFNPCPVTIT